jgi:hypothetical protein
MKKEVTMTIILLLVLIAVSLCFWQILLRPAEGFLNFSYIAALIAVGVALLVLFGIFIKRLFVRHA